MGDYYQGQKAENPATGETLIYDVKKGWQAETAKSSFAGQLSTQDAKDISEARAAALKAASTDQQAQRFGKLNHDVMTGPGHISLWGFKPWIEGPKTQAMEAITDALAPAQRIAGSGSSSDTDVKMFKSGLPSIDKFGGANARIVDNLHNLAVQARARSAFYDNWAATHGTLNGATEAFQQKLDEISNAPSPEVAAQLVHALTGAAAPANAPGNAYGQSTARPTASRPAAAQARPAPAAARPALADIFK